MLVTSVALVEGLLRMKPEHVGAVTAPRHNGNGGATSLTSLKTSLTSLTDVLLREPSPRVRHMLQGLFASIVAVDHGQHLALIAQMIMTTISSISLNDHTLYTCDEFFQFVRNVLATLSRKHDDNHQHNQDTQDQVVDRGGQDILPITTTIVQLLVEGATTVFLNYDGTRTHEVHDKSQSVLAGLLDVLSDMVRTCPAAHRSLMEENKVVDVLLSSYLFKTSDNDDPHESICCTPQARTAAFSLLHAIAQSDKDGAYHSLEQLFLRVKEFQEDVDVWPGKRMNINVEDWKKNECGYVGLTNQGNTCYLNSTLQQIFMIKSLRRGLLSFQPPERSTVSLASATVAGNGSTSVQNNNNNNNNNNDDGKGLPVDNMETMRQLQRSMAFLSESTVAGYNPKELVHSCMNLGLSENVYVALCVGKRVPVGSALSVLH
jgi:hypothetical protein